MSGRPIIRRGRPGDGPAARAVFHAAVHDGAAAHYSAAERAAWAPGPDMPADWETRLLAGTCLIAQDRLGRVTGFMTLADDGFLDYAYVLPRVMGKGVAGALYDALEQRARRAGIPTLSTEASHLAQRFLARRGWRVIARQSVIRNGVALTNFRMEKRLDQAPPR